MKPSHRNPLLRNFVLATTICLTFGQATHAGSVYWDTNGTIAGSGAATGNWGSDTFWTTTEAGNVATNGTLPTADDDVFIAAGANGTTGTITIGTTKVAGSLTLQEPATSTGVVISGGTSLTLGGGNTTTKGLFVTGNGTHTVSTPLILSGANTIQTAGTGNLTINGGITGTGDLTLRNNSTGATGISIVSLPVNNTGAISNAGTSSGFVILGNANAAAGSGGLGANVTSFSQNSATAPFEFRNANNSAYTGNYDINAGTLHWGGTTATGTITATNAGSVINLGATSGTAAATFNVINNAVSGKLNNNIRVRGGSAGTKTIGVALTGNSVSFTTTGTITLDDNVTLQPSTGPTNLVTLNPNGLISDGVNGPKGITKAGGGNVNFSLAHPYGGTTSVTAGILALTGASGSVPSTSGISISGGTFQLNNTAAANNSNRIPDSTVITMTGGTLDFKNDANTTTSFSETIAVTAAGAGIINANQAAVGQTSTLTIGTFVRNPATTLSFTGTGLGVDARNTILFSTPPTLTNSVIPWATANATTFAAYDNTNGVTPATTTDIDAQGSTITDTPTTNLRILPDGSGAAIALGANTTSINTLVQANVGAAVNPTIDTASKTFRVNSILVAAGARPLTIGAAANDGTLTTGTAGGELFFINNSANTLTLNAIIADNTSASTVAKFGSGNATFAGNNSYTGNTTLTGGVITAANSSAFGSGAITILPGTTRLVINDGLTLANNITIKGGGASFRGLLENSSTGEATLGGIITIDGALSGGGHFASAVGGSLKVTGAVNSAASNVVCRIGTVIFSSGGSYSNFIVNEGTVRLGAANGLSTSATVDVGASGTTVLDLAGFDQTLVGVTRSGSVTATISNSSTTTNSILTVTGTSTYAGIIANVVSPGDKLTTLKIANGANITLTGSYTANTPDIQSGGTLTIGAGGGDAINPSTKSLLVPSGALLKFTGTNRINNDTVITVNSGGTFDQNGQFDTIGYITGAGSIINLNAGLTLNMPLIGSGSNFSGSISGTSGISVAGVGTGGSDTNVQILSGVNSFTGNVNVQRGLLRITNSSALGEAPIAGTKTISISATSNKFLELDGTSGDITLPATFLFSTSGANGTIRNLAGNNTIEGAFSLTSGNGNTKIVSDAGSLALNGNVTTVAGAGANRVLDLDGTSTANNAVNGVIGDGGGFLTGVTKNGIGKWILGGTNTYTNPTTINGGTLALSALGSIDNSPSLSISAGAKLDTTAKTSQTLPATLTIGLDGNTNTSGLIDATGKDLVISGAALTFNETGTLTAPVYVLANYATITGTPAFTFVEPVPGYNLVYNHNSGTQIALVKDTSAYITWGGPYGLGAGSEGGDLDNDGLTNFEEFAFGLIPNDGSSVNPITIQLDKTAGTFTYQRLAASGLTYSIWTSEDLSGWTKDTTASSGQVVTPGTPNSSVLVTLTGSKPLSATKLFVRVIAE